MIALIFAGTLLEGVAGIIIALATLVTAAGGIVAILVQNHRQHRDNQEKNAAKIDEAVTKLETGHAEVKVAVKDVADTLVTHAEQSLERDKSLAKNMSALKVDSDILFGMIVGVDSKVASMAKEAKIMKENTIHHFDTDRAAR